MPAGRVCSFYVLYYSSLEEIERGLWKCPPFFKKFYLHYIEKTTLDISHCIILHVARDGFFFQKWKQVICQSCYISWKAKLNLSKNSWILKDLKRHRFNYICHFLTGKEVKLLIYPHSRVAKIFLKYLEIANMNDFKGGIFSRRTFLLIQRVATSRLEISNSTHILSTELRPVVAIYRRRRAIIIDLVP